MSQIQSYCPLPSLLRKSSSIMATPPPSSLNNNNNYLHQIHNLPSPKRALPSDFEAYSQVPKLHKMNGCSQMQAVPHVFDLMNQCENINPQMLSEYVYSTTGSPMSPVASPIQMNCSSPPYSPLLGYPSSPSYNFDCDEKRRVKKAKRVKSTGGLSHHHHHHNHTGNNLSGLNNNNNNESNDNNKMMHYGRKGILALKLSPIISWYLDRLSCSSERQHNQRYVFSYLFEFLNDDASHLEISDELWEQIYPDLSNLAESLTFMDSSNLRLIGKYLENLMQDLKLSPENTDIILSQQF